MTVERDRAFSKSLSSGVQMMDGSYRVVYQAKLAEEAVLRRITGHPEESTFRGDRNRLYEMEEQEEKEAAFQRLHHEWFSRLGLHEPLAQILDDWQLLKTGTDCCVVLQPHSKKAEGIDLYVSSDESRPIEERRAIVIQVRPEELIDPSYLQIFLRRELLHIIDMINPEFQYEPMLPKAEQGAQHDTMLQDRYRALWDTTIDGRLIRDGLLPEAARERRFEDFRETFPMLGESLESSFERFFEAEGHSHPELVAFAQNPVERSDEPSTAKASVSRCSLCSFPTAIFEPNAEQFPAELIERIQQDFPQWSASERICPQCADLYRARRRVSDADI